MLQPVSRVAIKYGNQQEPVRSSQQQELGKDEFLLLLTQQLKYQDPLSPMDNQEFIAQMAQFSALEQTKNLNESMENFLNVLALNDQRAQAVSLLGHEVSGSDVLGEQVSGKVDAIRFESGLPVLLIDKHEVMFSDVELIGPGSGE